MFRDILPPTDEEAAGDAVFRELGRSYDYQLGMDDETADANTFSEQAEHSAADLPRSNSDLDRSLAGDGSISPLAKVGSESLSLANDVGSLNVDCELEETSVSSPADQPEGTIFSPGLLPVSNSSGDTWESKAAHPKRARDADPEDKASRPKRACRTPQEESKADAAIIHDIKQLFAAQNIDYNPFSAQAYKDQKRNPLAQPLKKIFELVDKLVSAQYSPLKNLIPYFGKIIRDGRSRYRPHVKLLLNAVDQFSERYPGFPVFCQYFGDSNHMYGGDKSKLFATLVDLCLDEPEVVAPIEKICKLSIHVGRNATRQNQLTTTSTAATLQALRAASPSPIGTPLVPFLAPAPLMPLAAIDPIDLALESLTLNFQEALMQAVLRGDASLLMPEPAPPHQDIEPSASPISRATLSRP